MLYCGGGEITLLAKGESRPYGNYEKRDERQPAPLYLGTLTDSEIPEGRGEELYEAAQFSVDNDSLERREYHRAGQTAIPEVQAARDAFFGQATYLARGCDNANLFDGNPDTYFDGQSRYLTDFDGLSQRIGEGCLRVDFGDVYAADEVEITCFAIHEPITEIKAQIYPEQGSYSADLRYWQTTASAKREVLDHTCTAPAVKAGVHSMVTVTGDRVRVIYGLNGSPIRYFRLPAPMDRIYSVRLLKEGRAITLTAPKANNLQAAYGVKTPVAMRMATVTLPRVKDGDYVAVALNGVHGHEGAYCTAEVDGRLVGFPDRAPAYVSNVWEFCVRHTDRNYTYYLPLDASMSGKEMIIRTLLCDGEHTDFTCDVWLCPRH